MWLALALSAAVVWGFDYAIAQKLFERRISPITLLFIQMAVGTVALGVISLFSGKLKKDVLQIVHSADLRWFTALALLGFVIANVLIAFSIKGKNAALAGIVEISYPLFIVLFSVFMFEHTFISLGTVIGGVLIFAGVVVIQLFPAP